jgi:hypothetical protein
MIQLIHQQLIVIVVGAVIIMASMAADNGYRRQASAVSLLLTRRLEGLTDDDYSLEDALAEVDERDVPPFERLSTYTLVVGWFVVAMGIGITSSRYIPFMKTSAGVNKKLVSSLVASLLIVTAILIRKHVDAGLIEKSTALDITQLVLYLGGWGTIAVISAMRDGGLRRSGKAHHWSLSIGSVGLIVASMLYVLPIVDRNLMVADSAGSFMYALGWSGIGLVNSMVP